MEAAALLKLQPRSPIRPAPASNIAEFRRRPGFELRCSACGYGVVVRMAPENCPMCKGSTWEHAPQPRPPGTRFR